MRLVLGVVVGMRDDGGEDGDAVGDGEGGVRGSLLPPLGGGVRLDGPQEARVCWGDIDDEDFFVLVVLWDWGWHFDHHPWRGGSDWPLPDGGTVA